MRYYQTEAQKQALKKMSNAEIFNAICTRKMTGLCYHDGLYKTMVWLGLAAFAKQQEEHLEEESESLRETEAFSVEHLGVIPEAFPEKVDVDPFKIFGKVQRVQPSRGDKEKVLSRTFSDWLTWETETNNFLKDIHDELENRKCTTQVLFLEDLIEDNDEEIKNLKQQMLELADVDYDLKYIHKLQYDLED